MIAWMQQHRKYLVVTIWISTIAFVGAGFVGWGAYSFNADKANAVAKVGEHIVSGKELQSTYNNIYSYYNQMMGGKLTQEKAEQMRLQDIAMNQLIKETLFLNYADELGITALDSEVAAKIQSIDNFKQNGSFDKETYFNVLKAINKEPKEFEEGVKKEIIVQKLTQALKLPASSLEVNTLSAIMNKEIKVSAKLISVDNTDINITDDALEAFWKDRQNNYLSEESFEIELITLKAAEQTVEENDLQLYYDENRHTFQGADDKILSFEDAEPEVRIAVQQKAVKKEILKKYLAFKNGEIKADETKVLTASNSHGLPLKEIAAIAPGEYIKALELPDGYATLKLVKITKPEPLSFETAKAAVTEDYLKSQKAALLEERAKESSDTLTDATDLGYLGESDVQKVSLLGENEAAMFLQHLFSKPEKNSYFIFSDKAIVYQILDQKLGSVDSDKEAELRQNIEQLKNSTIQNNLLEQLQKRYKVEQYYKG